MKTLNDIIHPVPENFSPQAIFQVPDAMGDQVLNWVLAAASSALFEQRNDILVIDSNNNPVGILSPSELEEAIGERLPGLQTRGALDLPGLGPLTSIHPLVYVCPQDHNHPMHFYHSRPVHPPICPNDNVPCILWKSNKESQED
jgi:hypothetical protein